MGKRHSKKRTSRRSKIVINGGDGGATGWAQSVYGGIGQQHQVAGNNHEIAMNPQTGGANLPLSPSEVGGSAGSDIVAAPTTANVPVSVGGGIITDVAVPAVLLYARDSIRKRNVIGFPKISMKKSRRHRRSYRKTRR